MAISKTTVDETLQTYLEGKGLSDENTKTIVKKLHKEITSRAKKEVADEKKRERKEREREKKIRGRTKTLHGTSCPRIMSTEGDLIVEF